VAKKGEFELKELQRACDYEDGFDALKAVLAYLYSGKVKPLRKMYAFASKKIASTRRAGLTWISWSRCSMPRLHSRFLSWWLFIR
jgi:hypothetical protein